jgi:CRP-like cAMP-binding protein
MIGKKLQANLEGAAVVAAPHHLVLPISLEKRVQMLAQVTLFRDLSQRDLQHLAGRAIQREYPARTVIVRQGDVGLGLYLLMQGLVLVWQGLPNGLDRRVTTLGSGERFGETTLLDAAPCSATVTALEASSMLVVSIVEFRALLYDEATVAIRLLAVLARRVCLAEATRL